MLQMLHIFVFLYIYMQPLKDAKDAMFVCVRLFLSASYVRSDFRTFSVIIKNTYVKLNRALQLM